MIAQLLNNPKDLSRYPGSIGADLFWSCVLSLLHIGVHSQARMELLWLCGRQARHGGSHSADPSFCDLLVQLCRDSAQDERIPVRNHTRHIIRRIRGILFLGANLRALSCQKVLCLLSPNEETRVQFSVELR